MWVGRLGRGQAGWTWGHRRGPGNPGGRRSKRRMSKGSEGLLDEVREDFVMWKIRYLKGLNFGFQFWMGLFWTDVLF